LDTIQALKIIDKPGGPQFNNWRYQVYDVLENEKLLIVAMNGSSGGHMFVSINITNNEHKEITKEPQEQAIFAACLLRGSSPQLLTSSNGSRGGGEVRLFDATSGRPLSRWAIDERADFVSSDPLNPNLFYVQQRNKISVYDKNVNSEVRALAGLQSPREIQVPWVPGNQLVSNNYNEAKVWDLGSGKVIHSMTGLEYARRSSLYGNIVAITDDIPVVRKMVIYDLNEGVKKPAKEINNNNDFFEVFVTPKRIFAMTGYVWVSTPLEK